MKWQNALNDYKYYLRIERGLSSNSITNYALDIDKLIRYLGDHHIKLSPIQIEYDTIQSFIYQTSKELNTRSQSRLISGLRSFFTYLVFRDDLAIFPYHFVANDLIVILLMETVELYGPQDVYQFLGFPKDSL